MADLGELLGTLVVGLAHARRMADEESAVIAERYRENPLLAGMSVPRIRVQEMAVEVPVLVERFEDRVPATTAKSADFRAALGAELKARLADHGVELPPEAAARFDKELVREAPPDAPNAEARPALRETFARAAEKAFLGSLSRDLALRDKLTPEVTAELLSALRRRAREVGVISPGRSSRLGATLITNDVKDRATPETVTRIRLVLREEGLEWNEVKGTDGSKRRVLGPE